MHYCFFYFKFRENQLLHRTDLNLLLSTQYRLFVMAISCKFVFYYLCSVRQNPNSY